VIPLGGQQEIYRGTGLIQMLLILTQVSSIRQLELTGSLRMPNSVSTTGRT
jgi:hypothetical protein